MNKLYLLILAAIVSLTEAQNFRYSETLMNGVTLRWGYDSQNIRFELSAPTTGWIGLGFSPGRDMAGADLIISGVANSANYIYDAHALRNGPPLLDQTVNVFITSAAEVGGRTTVSFGRQRRTGDQNDNNIEEGSMNVIWAYGRNDVGNPPGQADYHAARGGKIIQLIKSAPPPSAATTTAQRPIPPTAVITRPPTPPTTSFRSLPPVTRRTIPQALFTTLPPTTTSRTRFTLTLDHTIQLDDSGSVTLSWSITGNNFVAEMTAPTLGWIGFGFSPGTNMAGADLVLMGERNGQSYAVDAYAERNGRPMLASFQNWRPLSSVENGTHTTVLVHRTLQTGRQNSRDITRGMMNVIWAFGPADFENQPNFYHGRNRGWKHVNLFQGTVGVGEVVTSAIPPPISTTRPIIRTPPFITTTLPPRTPTTRRIRPPPLSTTNPSVSVVRPTGFSLRLTHSSILDNFGRVTLSWSITSGNLIVQLKAPTLGWIGVGFSPGTNMADADIVMMGVRNGQPYAIDTHAKRNGRPSLDDIQNWRTISASESATHTTVLAHRLLNTGDPNDRAITNGIINVIWAFGPSDIEDQPNFYHRTNRGVKMLDLMGPIEVVTTSRATSTISRRPPSPITSATSQAPETREKITPPFVIFPPSTTSQRPVANLPFAITLDNEGKILLRWGVILNNFIAELTAPTLGWVGFGFSPGTTMAGADLVIAGDRNGEAYALDTHAIKNGPPVLDESQDWRAFSSFENGTHTTVLITRLLRTGDVNDRNILEGVINVLWAFGSSDIIASDIHRRFYHRTNRGWKRLDVLQRPIEGEVGRPIVISTTMSTTTTTIRTKPPSTDTGTPLPHSAMLNGNGQVMIKWDTDNRNLILQVTAPTLGWIGIGFSPDGTMNGADLILMGERNGRHYAYDAFAEHHMPSFDEDQNINVLSSSENGTHTTVVIHRILRASDEHDRSITDAPMNIIWAFGYEDIISQPERKFYHGSENRGWKIINLISPSKTSSLVGERLLIGGFPTTEALKGSSEKSSSSSSSEDHDHDALEESPSPNVTDSRKLISRPTKEPRGGDDSQKLLRSIKLDEEGRVQLRWESDETHILLEMSTPNLDWMMIGFTQGANMSGADIAMMGIGEEGPYVHDSHISMNGSAEVDESQDFEVVSVDATPSIATIRIRRLLNTGDEDDIDIMEGMVNIVWAYGSDDFDILTVSHEYRGIRKINLLSEEETTEEPESDYKMMAILAAFAALLIIMAAKLFG